MSSPYALGVPARAEGVPVSGRYYFRTSTVISGGEAGLRAGPGGVSIGRFGWVDTDGIVLNERTADGQQFGIVAIQGGDWRRVFWDATTRTWKIRQGLNITLLSASPGVWVKLRDGGVWNDRVYTDPVDGRVVAGYVDGLEPTSWAVALPTAPGGLSLITTWNQPNG